PTCSRSNRRGRRSRTSSYGWCTGRMRSMTLRRRLLSSGCGRRFNDAPARSRTAGCGERAARSPMKKAFIIARREFIAITTRKAYLFAVVGVPAFVGGLVAILVLTAGMSEQSDVASKPIGVVDEASVLEFRASQPSPDNDVDVPGVLFSMQAGNPNEIVRYT